jgi:hypothetical protein
MDQSQFEDYICFCYAIKIDPDLFELTQLGSAWRLKPGVEIRLGPEPDNFSDVLDFVFVRTDTEASAKELGLRWWLQQYPYSNGWINHRVAAFLPGKGPVVPSHSLLGTYFGDMEM